MPAKKNDKTDITPSLDELLGLDNEKKDSVAEEENTSEGSKSEDVTPAPTVTVESFESAELAALREELAKAQEELAKARTNPTDDTGRPLPEAALTPEQREIRTLQDQLARTRGKSLEALQEEQEDVGEDGILIHILEDGFTALGQTFYRGQEIVVGPKAYEDTQDRFGFSWLSMTDEEQYARWGVLRFRKGPWPGQKKYEEEAVASKSIRTVAPVTKI